MTEQAPGPGAPPRAQHLGRLVAEALAEDSMAHEFQPIWNLIDGTLFGFEGLARFPEATPPEVWATAMAQGQGRALDLVSLRTAIFQARSLPGVLFLNMHPSHISLARGPSGGVGVVLSRYRRREAVVLEVIEAPERDRAVVLSGIERLRTLGIRLALDDAGEGEATLERLAWLNPAFVKLDRSLVGRALAGETEDLVRWVRAARAIRATVIAEGVEDADAGPFLHRLDVDCVQGFGFGPPKPAEAWEPVMRELARRGALTFALSQFSPPNLEAYDPAFSPLSVREVGDLLYADLPFPVVVVAGNGLVAGLNRQGERFWGVHAETVAGQPAEEALGVRAVLAGPEDEPSGRTQPYRIRRPDGSEVLCRIFIFEVLKRGRPYTVMIVVDDAHRAALPAGFSTDPLTGFYSRLWWDDVKTHEMGPGAVVCFLCEGIQAANDLLGREAGDAILKAVAGTIRARATDAMWLVRYGGDSFLAVCPEVDEEEARLWAEAVVAAAEASGSLGIPVRVVFGCARFAGGEAPAAEATAAERLREVQGYRLPTSAGGLLLTAEGRAALWPRDMIAEELRDYGPEFDDIVARVHAQGGEEARRFVAWIAPEPGAAVVEVAAGSGRLALDGGLLERTRGGRYLITDPSGLPLAACYRRIPAGADWVSIAVAAPEALPLVSGSADLAVGSFLLPPEDARRAMAELARVVRPGGRVAVAAIASVTWSDGWEAVFAAARAGAGSASVIGVAQCAPEGMALVDEAAWPGAFTFPSVDHAYVYLVRSRRWQETVGRSAGGDERVRAHERAKAAIAALAPQSLTLTWRATYRMWRKPRSREDDSPVLVDDHPVLDVPADGAG